jgi:hypothetical protein
MKYIARFNGCRLGAIGITYPCRAEVEADTPELARLKLFDTHEHITRLKLTSQELTGSVPSVMGRDRLRKLIDAAQGRYRFATPREAQAHIDGKD